MDLTGIPHLPRVDAAIQGVFADRGYDVGWVYLGGKESDGVH